VINVGGNRISTEEIESALLADTERRGGSPLRNCVVVGMPDAVRGTAPVAFVVLHAEPVSRDGLCTAPALLDAALERRLRALVLRRLGKTALPAMMIDVPSLPETYSGKYVRRIMQALLAGAPLGDVGSVKNPECLEPLRLRVRALLEARAWITSDPSADEHAPGEHFFSRGDGDGDGDEPEEAHDATHYDSMALIQPRDDDHSLALQGHLMFLVICSVIHTHYCSKFIVNETPWIEVAHLFERWGAMLCAFMLVGRNESVRCPLNRPFVLSKLLKPSLLLVVVHWLNITTTPSVLAFQADVLRDPRAFHYAYINSWFLCVLLVFRLLRCAAALAGVSPSQLAVVAVLIYAISEPATGIVTKPAAAALSVRGVALMAGACERHHQTKEAPSMLSWITPSWPGLSRRLFSSLCLPWVEEVFGIYWVAYCVAPWLLHGACMRPSWIRRDASPPHSRPWPLARLTERSWAPTGWRKLLRELRAFPLVSTLQSLLPCSWTLFVVHTLCTSPGPAVRSGFGKCDRLGGPLPLGGSQAELHAAWLMRALEPTSGQRVECCKAMEPSVRGATPSIEVALHYFRIEYYASLWAVLALVILAHDGACASPVAWRETARRLVAATACLAPFAFDVTAKLLPPPIWNTLPHASLPLQAIMLKLVSLGAQFGIVVAWASLLPRRHTFFSRAGLTPVWAYLFHQTIRIRLAPTANAHLKLIHEWSGGWMLPAACAPTLTPCRYSPRPNLTLLIDLHHPARARAPCLAQITRR
jgi:hypothetical protein